MGPRHLLVDIKPHDTRFQPVKLISIPCRRRSRLKNHLMGSIMDTLQGAASKENTDESLRRLKRLLTLDGLRAYYLELAIVVLAVAVHYFHLGSFPAFFIDEGTYIGFGLSFSQTGNPAGLAGNFFFHPFLSWILEGSYFRFIAFPEAWNSSPILLYSAARTLPAALSIVEVPLLYLTVLRAYAKKEYAILAAGLFATTPLSARYLRMVLLDCFLLFFLILSLTILVCVKGNRGLVFSGIAFGLAALSKLPALFFLPAFAALFLSKGYNRFSFDKTHLRGFIFWLVVAAVTFSVWPVYAMTTGHYGDFVANLGYESVRTGELALTLIVQRLVERDIFLFVGLAGIVYGLYKRDIVGSAFTISYIGIFLLRGLRVSSYYLIPVLPFISILGCLLIVDAVEYFSKNFSLERFSISRPMLVKIVSIVLILGLAFASIMTARGSAAGSQSAAIGYVLANAPSGSLVVSSPAFAWTLRSMRSDLMSYDWFAAPWNSLPHAPKTYLMVDPGFDGQIQEVPQLAALYNQTRTEATFPGTVLLEVRSTNMTVTIP